MNIGNIIKFDTGNARGLSVVVFVSGCTHHCPMCHNKETWDFDYGTSLDFNKQLEINNALDNSHIRNLVISGGDPLHPNNLEGTLLILVGTKSIRTKREQSVIIYTGYTFEQLQERIKNEGMLKTILEEVNLIIDGTYDETKKTKTLDYRGSTNQRCWQHIINEGWIDISDYYFKEGGIK